MELEHAQEMDEYLLRKELERLISQEPIQVAINQAIDYLKTIPQIPMDQKELMELIMQTDEIYNLIQEMKGMMIPVDQQTKEEMYELETMYEEKSLMSFLEDLMNWEQTR